MSDDQGGRAELRELFDLTVELPAAERQAALERACGSDSALRRELQRLLDAHDQLGGMFDTAFSRGSAGASRPLMEYGASALSPGTRLGRYEIIGLAGSGGMGEVYTARDARLDRTVAIKVLPGELTGDAAARERLEREARAAAALAHPHICRLLDIGRQDDLDYLVLEYLEGETLRARLQRGKLSLDDALTFAIEIAQALAAAHGAGILHRDLKPANVMLTSSGTKLLDFGLATRRQEALVDVRTSLGEPPNRTEAILGTVSYMAPEQLQGWPADERTEVFAFGAVLYEMITGRRAFEGKSDASLIANILHAEPPALSTIDPAAPPPFDRLLRACLAKNPDARPQSMATIVADLNAIGTSVSASGTGERGRTRQWRLALGASIVLALAVGTTVRPWVRSQAANPHDLATADARRRVVAVLPFQNLSADPAQDYFAAGIAADVHAQLSKLAELVVLSREAVEGYSRRDVRRLATELGAINIVTGSVRVAESRMRVTVELVNARTDQTLWSEQYDRQLQDMFAIQSDVALRVADSLAATISSDERQRLEKASTTNLEAYALYQQSELLPCGNGKAVDILRRAVTIDPRFAVARARMAYHLLCQSVSDRRLLDLALQNAGDAVRSDPTLADAHMTLASVYGQQGKTTDARVSFVRALALDPSSTYSMTNLSEMETEIGQYDEALLWSSRAFPLAPAHAASYFHIGLPLLYLGDDAVSERWLAEAERRFPTNGRIQALLSMLDAMRGRMTASVERAHRAFESGDSWSTRAIVAEVNYLGRTADAEAYAEELFRKSTDPSNFWLFLTSPRVRYADLLMRRGEKSNATRLMAAALREAEQALANGDQSPRVPLDIAAIHALRGENGQALDWLQRAYDAGLRDFRTLRLHPIFERLKEQPRFKKLLKRMDMDVTEMRRRVDIPQILATLPRWRGPQETSETER